MALELRLILDLIYKMTQFTLLFGSFFGMTAIIFGAFGAHLLKKTLSTDQLASYETGIKYQMYHAILLVALGLNLDFSSNIETYAVFGLIIGTILFSFSIYGLVLSSAKNKKLKFLGPITPIGGLFLVAGWLLLFLNFLS